MAVTNLIMVPSFTSTADIQPICKIMCCTWPEVNFSWQASGVSHIIVDGITGHGRATVLAWVCRASIRPHGLHFDVSHIVVWIGAGNAIERAQSTKLMADPVKRNLAKIVVRHGTA